VLIGADGKTYKIRAGTEDITEETTQELDPVSGKIVEKVIAFKVSVNPLTGEVIKQRVASEDKYRDLETGQEYKINPHTGEKVMLGNSS
jgi:hypothetical protein